MKNLTVFSTAVLALALTADAMAQSRGPRYNPGGGSSGSSSSSSTPRGPSYNPGGSSGSSSSSSSRPSPSSSSSSRPSPSSSSSTPRRPSYNPGGSSSSTSTTPRGPSYNPSPSAPSRPSSPSRPAPSSSSTSTTPRGPSYNPSPSRPAPSTTPSTPTYTPSPTPSTSTTTTPRGPRYNPSPDPTPSPTTSTPAPTTPRGPRYNPDSTPTPSRPTPGPVVVTPPTRPTPIPVPNPGSVHVPRGPRYNPPSTNIPAPHRNDHIIVRRTVYNHVPHPVSYRSVVYYTPRDYYLHVNRHYIYYRWIQEPVIWTYTDGYWDIDNYPYYVDDGYRYRYSPVETCKYDLVDGNDYTVVRQFEEACNTAFDRCAVERDNLNSPIGLDRFFCAESVDDDLVVEDRTEYNPLPTEMTPVIQANIESYLRNKTLLDIFEDGRDGVGKCKIEKRFLKKCKYMVKVEGKSFPEVDGSVCSAPEKAALAGCKETDQKGNAGCLLEKAILQGLCLE